MLSLPRLFLLILMTLIFRGIDWPGLQKSSGVVAIILVIGVLSWMIIARLVRGTFLSLREKEFVEAARALRLYRPAHHHPPHPCPMRSAR